MEHYQEVQPNIIRWNQKKYLVTGIRTVCFGFEPFQIADCKYFYKNTWHMVKNVQYRKTIAEKYLEEQSSITKDFTSAEDMYHYLTDGQSDLYNPNTQLYVFLYNESKSLCTYYLSNEAALKLAKQTQENQEYWAACLGTGGKIYDGEQAMDLCQNIFSLPGWIKTDKYLDYLFSAKKPPQRPCNEGGNLKCIWQ